MRSTRSLHGSPCCESDAGVAFARNRQTGLLSFTGVAAEGVGGVSGLLGVAGLAADPGRKQVYAAGATSSGSAGRRTRGRPAGA